MGYWPIHSRHKATYRSDSGPGYLKVHQTGSEALLFEVRSNTAGAAEATIWIELPSESWEGLLEDLRLHQAHIYEAYCDGCTAKPDHLGTSVQPPLPPSAAGTPPNGTSCRREADG